MTHFSNVRELMRLIDWMCYIVNFSILHNKGSYKNSKSQDIFKNQIYLEAGMSCPVLVVLIN